jgi:anthranilate synthase component II
LYKFTQKKIEILQQVLLLDNYDSFTYNLEHYLVELGADVDVVRNDSNAIDYSRYDTIVLSPGPGLPSDAGGMMRAISIADGQVPILGVCLGMQGIAEYLGGAIYNQTTVKHGVQEAIDLSRSILFEELNDSIKVGLYHSWAVKEEEADFEIVARSSSNVIMAIENQDRKMYGIQFHPESIMTESGKKIIQNFLELSK